MFQSTITRCGGRSASAETAALPSVIARTDEPASAELLAQRFDGGNIPIDDENLFMGIGGVHIGHCIRGAKLYNTLTFL